VSSLPGVLCSLAMLITFCHCAKILKEERFTLAHDFRVQGWLDLLLGPQAR
jgi:hypothetical protein